VQGLTSFKVNLDPAAEYVPYTPDFDVRTIVRASDVARKYGLGPNGALVKSVEIVVEKLGLVVEPIEKSNADYVLIDTPGQMEVFIFRELSTKLLREVLRITPRVMALFVVDAELIKRYEDYAFVSLMGIALQARLGIDVVPVLNKVDLASDVTKLVGDGVRDFDKLAAALSGRGAYRELLVSILETAKLYGRAAEVPKVSATKMYGMEELHRIVHEIITCSCGDLT